MSREIGVLRGCGKCKWPPAAPGRPAVARWRNRLRPPGQAGWRCHGWRTEFDLLATLASHPGVVFTRRQLTDTVWGERWVGDEHLVDVHIGHLRHKFGDDAEKGRFIRTLRGVGYRMGEGR